MKRRLSKIFALSALAVTYSCTDTSFQAGQNRNVNKPELDQADGADANAGDADSDGGDGNASDGDVFGADGSVNLPPDGVLEKFEQLTYSGIVDILVVVDNSNSMQEEQTNLAAKLGPLLSEIQGNDWQVAVVTTDPAEPCNRGLIKKGDADQVAKFNAAVTAGTAGANNERGVLRAVDGLGCQVPTKWLRDNSSIAVLILSDEDNCSNNGGDCDAADAFRVPTYLTNYITGTLKRTLKVQARVYGLIFHPNDNNCPTGRNRSTQYAQLVNDTGGAFGSICAADYTPTLKEISKNIAGILNSQFTLKSAPRPGTVAVRINGTVITSGFTVEGTILKFDTAPAPKSLIEVVYVPQ